MHIGELLRLVGGEIGRKHAILRASPPEKLAGGARRRGALLPASAAAAATHVLHMLNADRDKSVGSY